MQKWTVNEAQEGETITGLLLGRFPELRLEEAQRILKKGGVKVDGVRMKKDVPLVAGDVVEVYPDGDLAAFAPEAEVVYGKQFKRALYLPPTGYRYRRPGHRRQEPAVF